MSLLLLDFESFYSFKNGQSRTKQFCYVLYLQISKNITTKHVLCHFCHMKSKYYFQLKLQNKQPLQQTCIILHKQRAPVFVCEARKRRCDVHKYKKKRSRPTPRNYQAPPDVKMFYVNILACRYDSSFRAVGEIIMCTNPYVRKNNKNYKMIKIQKYRVSFVQAFQG